MLPYDGIVHLDARYITATQRGREMFSLFHNTEFCFSFNYLETILDDGWLSFPKPFFEKLYDEKSDYQYLYTTGKEYHKKAIETVNTKVRKAIYFVNILKGAYDEEIRHRKAELDKIAINNELIPDFDRIIQSLISSSQSYRTKLNNPYSKEEIESIRKISFDLKSDNSIADFFRKYYDSGVKVGV